MLRLGIGQFSYTKPYGFEKGVVRMKEQGYSCMDYQEFVDTETELFQKNPAQFQEYLKEQAKCCSNHGIEIFQTHGPWRYPPRDLTKEDRAERFEKMSRSIEGTAILGCKRMILHPIMPFTRSDEGYGKETWAMNLEFMGKLVQVARKYGVILCFENMPMPDFSMASSAKVLEFVKQINDEHFKICLDTGHSAIMKSSPAEDVQLIGKDFLEALHVHDNNGKYDIHAHPFTGVIDWEAFGAALYEIGFDGVINLEMHPPKKMPEQLLREEELLLYHKAEQIARWAAGER
jgi:sugar phosphate isomerase/epimerase